MRVVSVFVPFVVLSLFLILKSIHLICPVSLSHVSFRSHSRLLWPAVLQHIYFLGFLAFEFFLLLPWEPFCWGLFLPRLLVVFWTVSAE